LHFALIERVSLYPCLRYQFGNFAFKMSLFKDELVHLGFCLFSGLILYFLFGSFWFFPFCLLLGFLIDADHLVDYFYCFFNLPNKENIRKNLFNFSFHIQNFFAPCYYVLKNRKVLVPLHGWEYLPIFWLALRALGQKWGIVGLEWSVLAYFFHLCWDQHTSAGNFFSYFFLYRLKNDFSYQAYKKPLPKL